MINDTKFSEWLQFSKGYTEEGVETIIEDSPSTLKYGHSPKCTYDVDFKECEMCKLESLLSEYRNYVFYNTGKHENNKILINEKIKLLEDIYYVDQGLRRPINQLRRKISMKIEKLKEELPNSR